MSKNKYTIKDILGYAGMALAVLAISFVIFNLLRDINTEKVDQSAAPTVEEAKASIEEQEQTDDNSEQQEAVSQSTIRRGEFTGTNGYSVSGSVVVSEVDGQQIVKFEENFTSSSGPDLEVYLSKNTVQAGEGLGEFVSLKTLKSNDGAQVYVAPENIDEFKSVVIWCRAFSVQFGAADIQ